MDNRTEVTSSAATPVVLLLSARGSSGVAQRVRLRCLARQLGLAVGEERVFRRRRRGRLLEGLRAVVPVGTKVVLVEKLGVFAKRDPVAMLCAAAEIRTAGIAIVSADPNEAWLWSIGPSLPAIGCWLGSVRKEQRRATALEALRRSRSAGNRVGRPRRDLGDLNVVLQSVASVGVAQTAARLRCGETTVRRFLRTHPLTSLAAGSVQ